MHSQLKSIALLRVLEIFFIMGKHQIASTFFLLLNFGTLISSLACDCSNHPPAPPPPSTYPSNSPPPPPPVLQAPLPPPPVVKSPPPPPPVVKSPPPPILKSPPPPLVGTPPPPDAPKQQTCPIDALQLGACVDVLGGLIHIGIGGSPKEKCCPLLQGLVDLDAAICLCTAIRVNALNLINLLVPISLQVLVNDCGKHPPAGFQCPP